MFEQIIGLIAPHECLACRVEGGLLCPNCLDSRLFAGRQCVECAATTSSHRTVCDLCIQRVPLDAMLAACEYKGVAKQLVAKLKFERSAEAAKPMARAIADIMPQSANVTVVPVPTASKRVRIRGYDQAAVIARQVAQYAGVQYTPLLARVGQQRQLGNDRRQRRRQLSGAFWVRKPASDQNMTYVLIDDVMTTGSTMVQAATVLRHAGAKSIIGITFAVA